MRKSAILLGGPQGSGKTTAAETIAQILMINNWHVEVIKFADPMYSLGNAFEKMLAPIVGREPNILENAAVLQDIGDIGRIRYGERVWIDVAKARAIPMVERGAEGNIDTCIIFEDVRKIGELKLAKELEADGFKTISMYFDAPEEVRKARLGPKYRSNTSHSTESEVQQFKDQFNMVIKTDGPEEAKNAAVTQLLKDAGFYLEPKSQLSDIVDAFNAYYKTWSVANKYGANFEFYYDIDGSKKLKVRDAAPIESLPEDVKIARLEEAAKVLSDLDTKPPQTAEV